MSDTHILVVEDDMFMQQLVSSDLTARGYGVTVVSTGESAVDAAATGQFHLALLDIQLQGPIDGIEVCRRIRMASRLPIIMLTVKASPETKVQALELGCDDYLTKPFHSDELVARVRAVLRRSSAEAPASAIRVRGLQIDLATREIRVDGQLVRLTRIEFDMLKTLAARLDRVVTYREMIEAVWEPGYEDLHGVHVHMSNLRRKIERSASGERYIHVVTGVGYRLHNVP